MSQGIAVVMVNIIDDGWWWRLADEGVNTRVE